MQAWIQLAQGRCFHGLGKSRHVGSSYESFQFGPAFIAFSLTRTLSSLSLHRHHAHERLFCDCLEMTKRKRDNNSSDA